MTMDNKYFSALSRIFSPLVMDSIVDSGYSGYLSEVCRNSGLLDQLEPSLKLSSFFDTIYQYLFKNFRGEYIYKNEIARKILLGRHGINTANMLTEFRAGDCKADVVIFNATSTAYEIKSELDSFSRLKKQINAYLQVFDHINVINSPSQVKDLQPLLPDCVGILVLTDRRTISTIKESQSNLKNIRLDVLFNSLRKTEYTQIIRNFYGQVPEVPNTLIYRQCKELFCKIPVEEAHSLTVAMLKQRNQTKVIREYLKKMPSSLTSYTLTIANQPKKVVSLYNKLNCDVFTVITSSVNSSLSRRGQESA